VALAPCGVKKSMEYAAYLYYSSNFLYGS
jgi:hypothetical protein